MPDYVRSLETVLRTPQDEGYGSAEPFPSQTSRRIGHKL
jgi:hypothetical protein